ncbi:hypothetical protein HY792_03365 [Candidatus Desantisbacteria bacterium]|nr:hypothetical protein [Candidatus Desantisbacteria bacterium]
MLKTIMKILQWVSYTSFKNLVKIMQLPKNTKEKLDNGYFILSRTK